MRFCERSRLWWIANVEMAINDEVSSDIGVEAIIPGPVLMLQLLAEIALSPGDESRSYLRKFQRLATERGLR